ncbi:hypothetical protein BDD30_4088 [Photorhabdus asymbiotica]|uniref:Uncharacterized protein n=1 Tax=Photorhabdus asymbiotica TaxID=291112 RepID=A0ABX9SHU8_9GAMM|nr:hypothetical protein BDD30_4088 [Photorhabdus asymbiotica]
MQNEMDAGLGITELFYTLHPSSCCFVGCFHSPQSHSYLCSWGFVHLPSRCNLKSIGYMFAGNIINKMGAARSYKIK